MTPQKNVEKLERDLVEVNEKIRLHPLASRRVRDAQELVDAQKSIGTDTDSINQSLSEQDLPSVEELGKVTSTGMFGWWKLHRKKKKIENQLHRLRQ